MLVWQIPTAASLKNNVLQTFYKYYNIPNVPIQTMFINYMRKVKNLKILFHGSTLGTYQ